MDGSVSRACNNDEEMEAVLFMPPTYLLLAYQSGCTPGQMWAAALLSKATLKNFSRFLSTRGFGSSDLPESILLRRAIA